MECDRLVCLLQFSWQLTEAALTFLLWMVVVNGITLDFLVNQHEHTFTTFDNEVGKHGKTGAHWFLSLVVSLLIQALFELLLDIGKRTAFEKVFVEGVVEVLVAFYVIFRDLFHL